MFAAERTKREAGGMVEENHVKLREETAVT